jgi:hypothetical protein
LAVGGIMEFNLYRAGSKKIVESQISSDTTIEPPKKFPINKSEPTEPPVDEIKDLFDDK